MWRTVVPAVTVGGDEGVISVGAVWLGGSVG